MRKIEPQLFYVLSDTAAEQWLAASMASSELKVVQIPHLGMVKSQELRSKVSEAGGPGAGFLLSNVGQREAGALSFFEIEMGQACHLHELFVVPEYRGYGVGTALVKGAFEISAARGYRRISLLTRPLEPSVVSGELLRQWYGRMGFVAVPGHEEEMQFTLPRDDDGHH